MSETSQNTTDALRPTVVPVVFFVHSHIDTARVLLVNQAYSDECPNRWRLPQGGVESHAIRSETYHEAAVRELQEEVGLQIHVGASAMSSSRVWQSGLKSYHPHSFVITNIDSSDIPPDLAPNPDENVRAAKWAPLTDIELHLGTLAHEPRERTVEIINHMFTTVRTTHPLTHRISL